MMEDEVRSRRNSAATRPPPGSLPFVLASPLLLPLAASANNLKTLSSEDGREYPESCCSHSSAACGRSGAAPGPSLSFLLLAALSWTLPGSQGCLRTRTLRLNFLIFWKVAAVILGCFLASLGCSWALPKLSCYLLHPPGPPRNAF